MSTPHRATEEQWEIVEICREQGHTPWPTATCLLELRSRVETLEQRCKDEPPTLQEAQANKVHHEAELAGLEAWRRQHLIQAREVVAGQPAPVVKESLTAAPAGSLVERVAKTMGPQTQAAQEAGELPYSTACAALREVAAWLREREGRHTHSSVVIAGDLEQEANQ
jgi:hypothetical protein